MSYGFTYRGLHNSLFGVNLLTYTIHSPELREFEDEVSGRPGIVDYGTEWGKREIEMIIDIEPTDTPFKIQQSIILNWLKPTLPAGILVFDDVPDRFYFAKYTGRWDINQFGRYGQFTITMKCSDPFAYGPEKIEEYTIISSPQDKVVVSAGTEPTPPVIELTNTGTQEIDKIILDIEYQVE